MRKFSWIISLLLCLTILEVHAQAVFTNPLLPSGADPYSFYRDGYYYYTHTLGNRIGLWKTKNLADLKTAEQKIIYTPPQGTAWSKQLWAPEIIFLRGKWYAYFAADDGRNDNHRMYVVENASKDPMQGEWVLKGKVSDDTDKWAIDGDVFEYKNQLYMIWSGWEGDVNKQQDIYIAKMSNPWTISSKRIRISAANFEWEKHGDLNAPGEPPHVDVNEGPQALRHNKDLFIVFSASGCWTDNYCLGLLRFKGGKNLLDSAAWVKKPEPVFSGSKENAVYAPGHNSFFVSPNGRENWILYHANSAPGQGCGSKRSPRAQPFGWKKDGTPDFGTPVKEGQALAIPAVSN
jgi:GH43 family beta-xylosidase